MSVPSRSRNTAGQLSLGELVIFETGAEFVRCDSRCSQFANDDGTGMVRDLGRFHWRRLGGKRESEERNRSIARAGNIEHLPRFCRDVMRLPVSLKKHHALFAQRN